MQTNGAGQAHTRDRHRLLIGEPDEPLRGVLLGTLMAEGYEVKTAVTGTELLDKLAVSLHPEYGCGTIDVVVAESVLLGQRELRRLRSLAEWARIPPFVLLLDAANTDAPDWMADLGTAVTIDKPLDLDHLRKVARTLAASALTDWACLPANHSA